MACIPPLLVECEEIKSLYSARPGCVLDSGTQRLTDTATAKLRADKYSAKPRRQVFAPFEIVQAKSGRSENPSIRMRNPCNWQLISIHVRVQFFDPNLKRFFAKNGTPLVKEPLRQLRNIFRVLDQVADSNSSHVDAISDLKAQAEVPLRGLAHSMLIAIAMVGVDIAWA